MKNYEIIMQKKLLKRLECAVIPANHYTGTDVQGRINPKNTQRISDPERFGGLHGRKGVANAVNYKRALDRKARVIINFNHVKA